MKTLRAIIPFVACLTVAAAVCSCEDTKTYAELLQEENHYVNNFLANHRVVNVVPADNKFETGPDAPFYRLDDDGNLYMQVVEPGTPGDTVAYDDLIYFRFSRFPLSTYSDEGFTSSEGNDPVLGGNYYFRYGNYNNPSSYSFGEGVQKPLEYVPVDAQINIIIKSQYGMPEEMGYVQPYLYSIRYFRPKI